MGKTLSSFFHTWTIKTVLGPLPVLWKRPVQMRDPIA